MMEILLSPAKINLGLWVLEKRPDGFHNIYTVMHTVSLYDRIFIKPSFTQKITFSNPKIKPKESTVYKALKVFEEITGIPQNYEIYVEKNIPTGSGLGGGSSNAAVILKKINELAGTPISEKELLKIAGHIGSDVPFFIKGGFAVATGMGEVLHFFGEKLNKKVFIIYPEVESSTEEIYSRVTSGMLTNKDQISIIDNLLKENKFYEFLEELDNTLGKIAREKYPVIGEVLNTLEFLGYRGYITGSGSAVFSFGTADKRIKDICRVRNWKIFEAELI